MPDKDMQIEDRWCSCFAEYYDCADRLEDTFEQRADALGISSDDEDAYERVFTGSFRWKDSFFHNDPPAENDRAWQIIHEVIDDAQKKGAKELILNQCMDREDYKALNTLPASIGNLKDLQKLVLYRSHISYVPREIMYCENLMIFEPYTSYRLHWFPYEITKCPLADSTISTRALYGNYKLRPPFPYLNKCPWVWSDGCAFCSICMVEGLDFEQYWISQRIGSDIVPLLASVCSNVCLSALGDPATDYVPYPHKGGPFLTQPEPRW